MSFVVLTAEHGCKHDAASGVSSFRVNRIGDAFRGLALGALALLGPVFRLLLRRSLLRIEGAVATASNCFEALEKFVAISSDACVAAGNLQLYIQANQRRLDGVGRVLSCR